MTGGITPGSVENLVTGMRTVIRFCRLCLRRRKYSNNYCNSNNYRNNCGPPLECERATGPKEVSADREIRAKEWDTCTRGIKM
jgi:hypothetical protein